MENLTEKEMTCHEASQTNEKVTKNIYGNNRNLNENQIRVMTEFTEYLHGTELTIYEAQEMLYACIDNLMNLNFKDLKYRGRYYKQPI
jgi:hypothetical protein